MKRILLFLSVFFVFGNAYSQEVNFSRWQLTLDGGWSYRTAEVIDAPPEVESYIEGLRSGYNISGKGVYYFKKFIGAGLNVSVSNYSNEANNLNTKEGIMRNVSDNITIGYIAPCVGFRVTVKEKHSFPFDASVGVLWYKDKGYANTNLAEINGATLGVGIGAGYDYAITKNVAVGVKMSLLSGTLNSYTLRLNGGYKQTVNLEGTEQRENLSQFNLLAGVRFNF